MDTTLATSAPGVFAAGNLVHAAETADIAALSWVARGAADRRVPGRGSAWVPLGPEPTRPRGRRCAGLAVIGFSAAAPPLGRFVLRSRVFRRAALGWEARQDGR